MTTTIVRKGFTALRYARNNGLLGLLRLIFSKVRVARTPFSKISPTQQYEQLLGEPFGDLINKTEVSPKTINWFIPPVGRGSGGHLNIFRFISMLEDLGYTNRIIIVGEPKPQSLGVAKREINKWFFPLKADVYVGTDKKIPPAYFAMATSWPTAYYVRRFNACIKKCYFVQDFEPWFYPTGTDYLLAEDTYRFGFLGITAGSWLSQKLHDEFGMQTHSIGFSYDKDLYRPMPKKGSIHTKRRIFFYARPPTARRAFELGILVLREVCKQLPDVEVVLAGWDLSDYELPFVHDHAGLVNIDELADLYATCDVALVLSCSNLSLLPLELMGCGVPVVSNRAPHTEWLLNENNSILAESSISGLVNAIKEVLDSPSLANRLAKNGFEFASNTSWKEEALSLVKALEWHSRVVDKDIE